MAQYLSTGALAALIIAAPAAALAQTQDNEAPTVDAVISIGTRAPDGVNIERIGGSASVIDAHDMEARQVRAVSDVLRDIPGAAVSRSGSPGSITQLRLRGAESNHTLTLIDGIEANDPFQGEFNYATLLADDLGRVEVLRGPQSALYGSDAVAGVVSYSTLSGRDAQGLRLRAEGGSFDTVGAALRYGARKDRLDYAVSLAGQDSGGYPTQTDGLGAFDLGQAIYTASGRVGFSASDRLKLRAVLRYTRNDADQNQTPFPDFLVVDSPGAGYQSAATYWLAGLTYEAMEGLWSHSLEIQGVQAWRDDFNSAGFEPFVRDSRTEGDRIKASYVTTFRIEGEHVNHALTGAVDVERETYDQPLNPFGGPIGGRQTNNWGLVADYAAQIGAGSGFGASVRYDDNDLFENSTTWRVQAYTRVNAKLRLRAAAGTGIKNPTQFELFGFGFGFAGNPDLKAEQSRQWEVGADLGSGERTLGFTWFDGVLDNEIFSWFGGPRPAACPDPGAGLNTACNREDASTQRGLEVFAHARLSPTLVADAAYTYLDAKEDGFQEIRRAPNIASLNLEWRSMDDKFGANLNIRYNGKQQDSNFSSLTPGLFPNDPEFTPLSSPFGRVELPAYTLVNLAGRWKVKDDVELFGRIENLLDADYYEVITYRSQGRAAYVGVRKTY